MRNLLIRQRGTGPDANDADRAETTDTAVPKTGDTLRARGGDTVADASAAAHRWAHVSAMATLSLIVAVVAVGAVLTGLMATVGIALGVIGGALAGGGLVSASRRGVTGHSLATLGLLGSLAAILLGVLAIAGDLSWLDSGTDEVARAHTWLVAQLPWLRNW